MSDNTPYWRVIDSGPGSAAWNMAVDEALLITAGTTNAPPTLRIYSWDTPSLSIGSFQKADELDTALMARRGIPLVRRPTGGRAVLHDQELTYSVACPIPSPLFPSDLMGSYKKIGLCFIEGLKRVGVDAALVPVDRTARTGASSKNPLCFASPSWHEVLTGGGKLVGSAQRRLKASFLQQGSLLIRRDVDALVSLLRFSDETGRDAAREKLASKMTAISELGLDVSFDKLKEAIIEGFGTATRAGLVAGTLTDEELSLAERLMSEKYGVERWNLLRECG